ncbi:unnamed protein product [Amoebophrya sp. A25]|nr:unnamed protein product [Amoebophrya sp. A25]|eukprot:GSA25T00001504001.1
MEQSESETYAAARPFVSTSAIAGQRNATSGSQSAPFSEAKLAQTTEARHFFTLSTASSSSSSSSPEPTTEVPSCSTSAQVASQIQTELKHVVASELAMHRTHMVDDLAKRLWENDEFRPRLAALADRHRLWRERQRRNDKEQQGRIAKPENGQHVEQQHHELIAQIDSTL